MRLKLFKVKGLVYLWKQLREAENCSPYLREEATC